MFCARAQRDIELPLRYVDSNEHHPLPRFFRARPCGCGLTEAALATVRADREKGGTGYPAPPRARGPRDDGRSPVPPTHTPKIPVGAHTRDGEGEAIRGHFSRNRGR
jgi:hypothetical protein